MEVQELSLEGLKLIKPRLFCDDRGFFLESYRRSLYQKKGISIDFQQDNHSFSKKGTIRGMHFQKNPGQAKLVSVISGCIFDVAVDIRKTSITFGKWEGFFLDDKNHYQLLIPEGFAHGFCVVSNYAHVTYKVSNPYEKEKEKIFRWNDPDIDIAWPKEEKIFLSQKDKTAPFFQDIQWKKL